MNVNKETYTRYLMRLIGDRKPMTLGRGVLLAVTVFVVSFAVRSLHAVDLSPFTHTSAQPYVGLTDDYDRRAVSIVEGNGILVPAIKNPADTGLLSHAPGYSIYLSAIYASFGRSFFTVQAVQNPLNSLTPVLIILYGGLLLSWRVGFAAGLCAAFSHHLAYYSNLILPDALCALPIVVGVYLLTMSETDSQNEWIPFALAGLSLGLSAWLRPNGMLLPAFLGVMLVIVSVRRHRLIRRIALLVGTSCLVIAPITVRNYLIYREFVPIQIGTGLNLWEGIGESSGERFGAVAKDEEVALQEAALYNNPDYGGWWASPDGIQRDRDRVKKSLDIISRHPFWYSAVMLGRMREMLKYSAYAPLVSRAQPQSSTPVTMGDSENEKERVSRIALVPGESLSFLRPAVRVIQRVTKETSLPFVLLGAVVLFSAHWRKGMLVAMAPLYYLLIQSSMHTEFRYVLPMHYFLFVFAGIVWVLIVGVLAAVLGRVARRFNLRKSEAAVTSGDVRPF
ncbi:MAG TPA: glycosyltransferase family 39 protein [Blastocatellia bacterium]|nr:glycosyltransferase family 39 protein [Blastocatellia bacterium]